MNSSSAPDDTTPLSSGNVGIKMVQMLVDTARASAADLRTRVSGVRYADSALSVARGCTCLLFEFDGEPYLGEMRGRYFDVCVHISTEADLSIAVGLMLDGLASKIPECTPAL